MIILRSINCDDKTETRKYNTFQDFVNDVDTNDEEQQFLCPMLDDPIESIILYGENLPEGDFLTVNDLYQYAKSLDK